MDYRSVRWVLCSKRLTSATLGRSVANLILTGQLDRVPACGDDAGRMAYKRKFTNWGGKRPGAGRKKIAPVPTPPVPSEVEQTLMAGAPPVTPPTGSAAQTSTGR